MKAIYEPKGRALEYSPLAVNLYTGCPHGCKYCFAANGKWTTPEKFHTNVQPRKGILSAIENDCRRLRGDPRPILLCFTSDPYPPDGTCEDVTRAALGIMERSGMTAQILTKGGTLAMRDFDILKRNKWKFGTTMLFWTEESRQLWEPNAGTVVSRELAIIEAHKAGIETWVSVEPVIDPLEAFDVIKGLLPFVDFWKIGKINHNPEIEKRINWRSFLAKARDILGDRPHLIKHDLLEAAGERTAT